MPTKRAALKDYRVNFKVSAFVDVLVSAATPEDALAKGREFEGDLDNFLATDVDQIIEGSAELRGCWTAD